jgi:hypothetical protein
MLFGISILPNTGFLNNNFSEGFTIKSKKRVVEEMKHGQDCIRLLMFKSIHFLQWTPKLYENHKVKISFKSDKWLR